MSECDKLKLKRMYKCDTKECLDKCKAGTQCDSSCEYYKMNGMCDYLFVKQNCKKTCNLCDVCRDNYLRKNCENLKYNGRCCEKKIMENCMKTCNMCGII